MSTALTTWLIGYLFTLGAVEKKHNSVFMMIALPFIWPIILGCMWRDRR